MCYHRDIPAITLPLGRLAMHRCDERHGDVGEAEEHGELVGSVGGAAEAAIDFVHGGDVNEASGVYVIATGSQVFGEGGIFRQGYRAVT